MTDLVLVVATLAFIALCVAYVGWCDRIIGADPAPPSDDVTAAADHRPADHLEGVS